MIRMFTGLLCTVVVCCVIGCGSSAPITPKMSEAERQEKLRQDAELIKQERSKKVTR